MRCKQDELRLTFLKNTATWPLRGSSATPPQPWTEEQATRPFGRPMKQRVPYLNVGGVDVIRAFRTRPVAESDT